MEEMDIKLKIKNAYTEPTAPEALILSVTQRAKAITLGNQAQQLLPAAPETSWAELASLGLIGQLAASAPLPEGATPQQLARQLCDTPTFQQALLGGNLSQRLNSGELMRQVAGQAAEAAAPQAEAPQPEPPKPEGPML